MQAVDGSFDTVVVGLGAIGSACLLQLARRGQRVLGLDRWNPPHAWGSTHGESRITRCAIGEGDAYVPLVLRSHEIWRELEAETGAELLTQCGALIMAPRNGAAVVHGKADFVRRTISTAERFAIPHEVLDADAIMQRFPQFRLERDMVGYVEPVGGYVRPEACVAATLEVASRSGATVRTMTEVVGITREGGGVCVRTRDGGRFTASEVVMAAGSWSAGLLGGALAPQLRVLRQVLHWFAPQHPAEFAPERCPVFMWMHGEGVEDNLYGFPVLPGTAGVKVATETYVDVVADPDRLERFVAPSEVEGVVRRHIVGRLPGLSPRVLRSVVCPYTMTPDGDFLIERAPENDRVLLVSACSGHGFKHSAGLGELVAKRLVDGADELAGFGAARLAQIAV